MVVDVDVAIVGRQSKVRNSVGLWRMDSTEGQKSKV